jgi:O-antigen ligase
METILVLTAVLLSVFFSIVLRKYEIGLFFILLASNRIVYGGSLSLITCIGIALFAIYFSLIRGKKNKVFWIAISLSICYAFVIFFVQPYKINTLFFASYFVALLMFICTLLIKWSRESLIKFVSAYGIYIVVAGFLEKIFVNPMRISGTLTVATAYAVVLVIVWAIWFVEGILSNRQSIKLILFGSFLVLLAILFSGTRMGLLGLMMGIILGGLFKILIRNKNRNKNIVRKILIMFCLFCGISLLFIIVWHFIPEDMFVKRTFTTLIAGRLDESSMYRVLLWVSSFDIISEHKLWGVGPGNFPGAIKKYLMLKHIQASMAFTASTHAHNIYLIVLTEQGFSGFITLGIIILSSFASLLYKIIKYPYNFVYYGVLSGVVIMMVLGMVDAVPMYLPTICFGAWLIGLCATFRNETITCQSQ